MIRYIAYHLLFVEGRGLTPAEQSVAMGAQFDGGYFTYGNRMLAYLIANDAKTLDMAIASLTAWRVQELTSSEALAWSEEAWPINSIMSLPPRETAQYVGPAQIGADGRIERPLRGEPW